MDADASVCKGALSGPAGHTWQATWLMRIRACPVDAPPKTWMYVHHLSTALETRASRLPGNMHSTSNSLSPWLRRYLHLTMHAKCTPGGPHLLRLMFRDCPELGAAGLGPAWSQGEAAGTAPGKNLRRMQCSKKASKAALSSLPCRADTVTDGAIVPSAASAAEAAGSRALCRPAHHLHQPMPHWAVHGWSISFLTWSAPAAQRGRPCTGHKRGSLAPNPTQRLMICSRQRQLMLCAHYCQPFTALNL